MAFQVSTGLRDHLLVTGSLKAGVDGGVVRIYSGTVPATADAALSGNTLLVTISLDDTGAGIHLDDVATSGIAVKDPTETWEGTCVASGVATFYRFSGLADAGALSTTEKRVQGTVGTVLADLLVSSTTYTSATVRRIDSYAVGMPAAA